MSVYVDNALIPYGRMRMCHMIADTHEELIEMAGNIGVHPRHLQHAGTKREHFDICKKKRYLAIDHGAIPVTSKELILIVRAKECDSKMFLAEIDSE